VRGVRGPDQRRARVSRAGQSGRRRCCLPSSASAEGNGQGRAEVRAPFSDRGGPRARFQAMTTMTHDGYLATVELDEEAGLFHGEVVNTRDVLTFQGRTLDELKAAFADTIADYLDWCRERGKTPDKPFSGTFSVRVAPEVHRRAAAAAARE